MFWFFGLVACGILSPWPGIEPAPLALEGKVFTTGPPGKSPWFCLDCVLLALNSPHGPSAKPSPADDKMLGGRDRTDDFSVSYYVPGRMLGILLIIRHQEDTKRHEMPPLLWLKPTLGIYTYA